MSVEAVFLVRSLTIQDSAHRKTADRLDRKSRGMLSGSSMTSEGEHSCSMTTLLLTASFLAASQYTCAMRHRGYLGVLAQLQYRNSDRYRQRDSEVVIARSARMEGVHPIEEAADAMQKLLVDRVGFPTGSVRRFKKSSVPARFCVGESGDDVIDLGAMDI